MSDFRRQAAAAAVGLAVGIGLTAVPLWRQRRAALNARWHADHDPVTGLPNRRAVTALLERAARARRPHGLVMVDLDKFKTVNDTFGHAAGDQLLIQVGQRLAALPVAHAGRLSGDEFVLIVYGGPGEVAAAAAAARLAICGTPGSVAGRPVPVRASVGWATARPGGDPQALLFEADLAMYRAKTSTTGLSGPHPAPPGRAGRCRDWPR
jgi:diguanylate cyclase